MVRVSFASIVTLNVVALVAGLRPASADLLSIDSASFTYKYEMDYFPSDHPTVNVDGNATPDFSRTGIANMSVSGGVLTMNAHAAVEVVELDSDGPGSIWYDNSSPFKDAGYTFEIRAKVVSTSPNYPSDLSTNIALWTAPTGSLQNGMLQIAGSGTLWGGRAFEPMALDANSNMGDFHVFRFAQLPNPSGSATFSVWRDGDLLASGLPASEARDSHWIRLGAYQGIHWGATEVDYVRFTSGAFAPATVQEPPIAFDTPIVTYWDGPNLTSAVAQQAVAGGFNLVWTYSVDQLAIAQQYGLRALVTTAHTPNDLLVPASLDGGVRQAALDAFIDQVKVSPAASMYFLADEPMVSEFAGLGALAAYIRERDPIHPVYVNLLANDGVTGAANYPDYLNQYINAVQPSILSFDHYNFMTTNNGTQNYDMPLFFQNLAQVSLAARQAGIPFMAYVQGMKMGPPWRLPNTNELRWLNYTTLAYGAQGIGFFNYHRYSGWPDAEGGIEPNPDGTPTSVATALTTLNPEFAAVAKQVQSLHSIGAYHLGDRPPGTTRLPFNSPFTLSPTVSNTTYVEGDPARGMLIGLFGPDAQLIHSTFALVVNLDYVNGKTTTVTGPGLLSIFNATTSLWTPTNQTFALINLLPGGGILVGLTSAIPPLIPGDFDGDSDVDGTDLVVWKNHFGTANGATLATGDADGDGDVDGTDFLTWQTHVSTSASSETSPVPEPYSLTLFAVGIATVCLARRTANSLPAGGMERG